MAKTITLSAGLTWPDVRNDFVLRHDGLAIGACLTISGGVGTTIPGHGEEPVPFIETVDRRLYRAKRQGRDRIVVEG